MVTADRRRRDGAAIVGAARRAPWAGGDRHGAGRSVVAAAGYLFSGWLRTRAVTGALIAPYCPRSSSPPDSSLARRAAAASIFEHHGASLVDGLRLPHVAGLLRPARR
jgi:hypothetical protein